MKCQLLKRIQRGRATLCETCNGSNRSCTAHLRQKRGRVQELLTQCAHCSVAWSQETPLGDARAGVGKGLGACNDSAGVIRKRAEQEIHKGLVQRH